MPNKAPKRSFAKTINPFFVQPQSEAQTVQSLRKRLESRVIREMAGESVRKKSSKPAERRGIYHYAVLRKVPAGEFKGNQKSGYGGDKVITDFFIKTKYKRV